MVLTHNSSLAFIVTHILYNINRWMYLGLQRGDPRRQGIIQNLDLSYFIKLVIWNIRQFVIGWVIDRYKDVLTFDIVAVSLLTSKSCSLCVFSSNVSLSVSRIIRQLFKFFLPLLDSWRIKKTPKDRRSLLNSLLSDSSSH